jgi:hypothetical protein
MKLDEKSNFFLNPPFFYLSVDFFKMAAVAMETAKILKNWKTQK